MRGWVGASSFVSRDLHVCVFECAHACMWLEDCVALVRMLDCPFAGSVATVVFP